MNRKEAAELLPIIQAYVEGKNIQYNSVTSGWCDITESDGLPMGFLEEKPSYFRIKPEVKFRPFANAKECWEEMMKHQPFGWVNDNGFHENIASVMRTVITLADNEGRNYTFEQAFKDYVFADGTPFGVKVE